MLYLKLPAGERLQFLAGQYIDILMKDGKRRSFSMANAPHDDAFLQLHVRKTPGGAFSKYVFEEMKERAILRFEGPARHLLPARGLRQADASSSPAAPASRRSRRRSSTCCTTARTGRSSSTGARARSRDLYLPELPVALAARAPELLATSRCSRTRCPKTRGPGRTGFVHQAVLDDFPDLSGYQVYACGAPAMTDVAQARPSSSSAACPRTSSTATRSRRRSDPKNGGQITAGSAARPVPGLAPSRSRAAPCAAPCPSCHRQLGRRTRSRAAAGRARGALHVLANALPSSASRRRRGPARAARTP